MIFCQKARRIFVLFALDKGQLNLIYWLKLNFKSDDEEGAEISFFREMAVGASHQI